MVQNSMERWSFVLVAVVGAAAPTRPARAEEPARAQAKAAAPEVPRPSAGYDKGFFVRSEDEKFLLRIGARAQVLFSYLIREGDENEAQFSVPRARLLLDGNAFTKSLTYKLEVDFGKGLPSLKDVFLDYAIVPRWLHVRVGQWKLPYSRQNLASDFEQQFIERAFTHGALGADRDIGLAVHGGYEKSPAFEYALGVFNGTGDKSTASGDVVVDLESGEGELSNVKITNVPKRAHPTLVGRLGYNAGEGDPAKNEPTFKGYTEHDLEGGPVRFGAAASGLLELDADADAKSQVRAEIDYVLKAYGFTTTGAVYFRYVQQGEDFTDQAFDGAGWHVQAGYVIADHLEPALRYARLVGPGVGGLRHEIAGAVSVFIYKTNFQIAADGGAFVDEREDTVDGFVRTQMQGSF